MRSIRTVLISLGLTLILLALGAVKAQGVFAAQDPMPPGPPLLPTLHIEPALPCDGQLVTLVAVVPRCPPCVTSFTGSMTDPAGVGITIRWFACETLVACPPDTMRLPLGVFRAGTFSLFTQVRSVQLIPGTPPDSAVTDTTLGLQFTVARDCGGIPPIPLESRVTIGGQAACDSLCLPVVCPERPIRVRIEGAFPTSCGRVRKVEFIPSLLAVVGPPTVRVLLDSEDCLARPCLTVITPWVVDTVIPGLPNGRYQLPVEVAQVSCSDSILTGALARLAPDGVPPGGRLLRRLLPFSVSPSCTTVVPPRPPLPTLATRPEAPCADEPYTLLAIVPPCPPCLGSVRWEVVDGAHVRLAIRAFACPTTPMPCRPETLHIPMPGVPRGGLDVSVQVRSVLALGGLGADSVVVDTVLVRRVIPAPCDYIPPTPLESTVRIDGKVACDSCPPVVTCADRPIRVRLNGLFSTGCGHVHRVELIPSLFPAIRPPTVRVLLDSDFCLGRPCTHMTKPWVVDTVIPGLPAGRYVLPVEVAQVSCSDTVLPGRIAQKRLAFQTAAACTATVEPCFRPEWRPTANPFACATHIVPGGEAAVTFGVRSNVPLAGVQGRLVTAPLVVRNVEPIGFATGMNLQWVATDQGARFVLFSTGGTVIPPYPTDPLVDPIEPWPHLLRVTVGLPQGVAGNMFRVDADSLLGADPQAGAVRPCPVITLDALPGGVLVCRQSGCDVNGDGRGDVRDLVRMVHCILGGGPCPDTTAGRFDCDGDGRASLADILCCARALLRGAPPDTTPPIKETGLALRFGAPVKSATGVQLPLTLEGAEHVGALRMALRFPSGRYDVAGLTSAAGSGWLALHEVQGDEVVVGLIALAPVPEGATVPLTLALTLKPGQENGGDVTVTEADLSAPDGVALATDLPGTGTPIESPSSLSLAIHPNPIVGGPATVRFALPRAAHVDVGVYDIAGRRVATLAAGPLPAGAHSRTWDAAGARDGVYFVRMRTDGVEVAHKAVLRRGR